MSKEEKTTREYTFEQSIRNNNLFSVKKFIKQGINVNAKGDYAIQLACKHGHLEMAKYLVAQGADIHASGNLALKWAKDYNQDSIIEYINSLKTVQTNHSKFTDMLKTALTDEKIKRGKIWLFVFAVWLFSFIFCFCMAVFADTTISNGTTIIKIDNSPIDILTQLKDTEEKLKKKEGDLIRKYIFKLSPKMKYRKNLTDKIVDGIIKYRDKIEIKLCVSMMMQESGFNPKAIGGSDCGLYQVNIWYHAKNYKVSIQDLLNPETNIKIGLDILNNIYEQRHEKFKNTWFCFFNTSKWIIKDEQENEIAGRKIYYRHVMKHYNKLRYIK